MDKIIKIISAELQIAESQVSNTCKLLDEGATIPFISRYRKEATGGLDEIAIQSIGRRKESLEELKKRKATIIDAIGEAGKLTDILRTKIDD